MKKIIKFLAVLGLTLSMASGVAAPLPGSDSVPPNIVNGGALGGDILTTLYGPGPYRGATIYTAQHDICIPTRFGNMEDAHFCSVRKLDSQTPPRWIMQSYKSSCIITCADIQ